MIRNFSFGLTCCLAGLLASGLLGACSDSTSSGGAGGAAAGAGGVGTAGSDDVAGAAGDDFAAGDRAGVGGGELGHAGGMEPGSAGSAGESSVHGGSDGGGNFGGAAAIAGDGGTAAIAGGGGTAAIAGGGGTASGGKAGDSSGGSGGQALSLMVPCDVYAAYGVCRNCHGSPPNGAPMALVTLLDLKQFADSTFAAVSIGTMPAEGSLSPDQSELMLDWLEAGAKGVPQASCP